MIFADLGLKRPAAQDVFAPQGGAIRNISEERLKILDGDILFFFSIGSRW